MYFCRKDRNEMASMVYNWDSDQVTITLSYSAQVDAVVVTDGSRVLGLGDLGIGGLGISIGANILQIALSPDSSPHHDAQASWTCMWLQEGSTPGPSPSWPQLHSPGVSSPSSSMLAPTTRS